MTGLTPAEEFICPACGLPESQWPANHGPAWADLDAAVCTSAVRPLLREPYAWGGGSGRAVVSGQSADWTADQVDLAALYGTCETCGAPRQVAAKPRPGGGVDFTMTCVNSHPGGADD